MDFKFLFNINNCIKFKNLNLILKICDKSIGKSSVYLSFKNKGYIYFLLKNYNIIYIGASRDKNRIGRHQKTKDFDEVFYYTFENNDFWKFESLLIRNFKTKYNKDIYGLSNCKE